MPSDEPDHPDADALPPPAKVVPADDSAASDEAPASGHPSGPNPPRRRLLIQVGAVAALGALAAWRFWPKTSRVYIPPVSRGRFDQGYPLWAKILTAHVKDGRVNYARLKQDPADLQAFLRIASGLQGPEWVKWSTSQRQAFLINVYNASVVAFVLGHYPVNRFGDCGVWWRPAEREPVVRLFSRRLSVREVADDMLMKNFPDPRIPAALCLAGDKGGPLRGEPYTPSRLDAQLTEQQKAWQANPPAGVLNDWK